MKEEDLKKHLDNILIDGLIKEAQQDNTDFEAAMRRISDEDFAEIVVDQEIEVEDEYAEDIMYSKVAEIDIDRSIVWDADPVSEHQIAASKRERRASKVPIGAKKSSRFRILRPWIAAAASAAAIIAIVLIPSISFMNGKLCDSAVYMSEAYITASKGGLDLSTATNSQIKEALPGLEERYKNTIRNGGYAEDFPEAAWDLAVAYLKLHKKEDAVKVLKKLELQTQGTPMGDHCKKLIVQLD